MKIVLDTNVLVSGLINAEGAPGRIVDLMQSGVLEVLVDDRILAEYEDVLSREHLQRYFAPFARDAIVEFLRHETHRTVCTLVVADLPDAGDAPFLEVALSAGSPLVTGNLRHFPKRKRRGAQILSPRELLTLLNK